VVPSGGNDGLYGIKSQMQAQQPAGDSDFLFLRESFLAYTSMVGDRVGWFPLLSFRDVIIYRTPGGASCGGNAFRLFLPLRIQFVGVSIIILTIIIII